MACAAPAHQVATPAPVGEAERIFRVHGYVDSFGDENGRYWFGIADRPMRFVLPRLPETQLEPFLAILAEASERRLALWVHFDVTAGQVSDDRRDVAYPLCSVQAADASYGSPDYCPSGGGNADPFERQLALGVASIPERPEQALALLGEAGASDGLEPEARLLALRARVRAAVEWAERLGHADRRHDPVLVEALADVRRLRQLRPDDPAPRFTEARVLGELGAYDEALALYRELESVPGYYSHVAIASAILHRRQGDYARALHQLGRLVEREGPQDYMPFHYHRGWTLLRMGRYAEAVSAFTEGTRYQPDYGYALLKRACAYARLGRASEALADHQRAVAIFRTTTDVDSDAQILRDIADSEATAAELTAAAAEGRREPIPCRGAGAGREESRPRSPLLPAAGSRAGRR